MSLPASRDFDAVDAGPLPAATVNAIQDAIVGNSHGVVSKIFHMAGVRQNAMTLDATFQSDFEFNPPVATSRVRFLLPLRTGDRLIEWQLFVNDELGAPIDRFTAQITDQLPFSAGSGVVGSAQDSDGTGGDQELGEVLGAPFLIVDRHQIEGIIFPKTADPQDAGSLLTIFPYIYVKWDHP